MMDLFEAANSYGASKPLADRMRPRVLEEFLGQAHLLSKGSLLWRAIEADRLGSCIFYGPTGSGKTTLASLVAARTGGNAVRLNAVSSGVADAKRVIEEAKQTRLMYGKHTYLILDECHRWSKAQSDSVLGAIEEGVIIFVGTTTENPHAALTPAIVSRCRVFALKALNNSDVVIGLKRAVDDSERGLAQMRVRVDDDAYRQIAHFAGGDLRNAYNGLELAALTTPAGSDGYIQIDKVIASESMQAKTISVDDSLYYDMLSALCKSLRGSDPTASLYWAFRLIESGCDPLSVARRVVVHASEDVGLADNNALLMAMAGYDAIKNLGMPEGGIPLSQAIAYVANAPKSNAVVRARSMAIADAQATSGNNVPTYLRDRSFPDPNDDNKPYKYPHDYGGKAEQEYMPKELKGRNYWD